MTFFDQLAEKNTKITLSFFDGIYSSLVSEKIIRISSKSPIAKKAYAIGCFHVCACAFAFNKIKPKELVKSLREDLIFSVWSHQ
jgi:hypothetical protein